MSDVQSAARAYGIAPPGFRIPDDTHVGRVRLQIADLDRSIAYYESVIGFRVLERSGRVARLGALGDDRVLVELHEKPGVRSMSRRGRIGLYHFAILLPDRAALGRFVRHLSDIGARAGMSDHFVSEAIYLSDPDGLGIEVYADRPRSAWRVDDRQLEMTTIPLDVSDLVAAAGEGKWTGAPAGTTIGHVHLYVRDIGEASAFYHEALGLDKVVWNYPGALFMSAGGYHHHLGTNTWAAEAPVATDEDARLLDWELVLPSATNVRAAASSLQAHGFAVAFDGAQATTRDPWGTQLRLVGASG
ncbi:MAG TPA: VOC family protein [Gemmatimonadaceae bacterium]|nr:VOC family protein [Gemmatimonadaceae bacterium]